MRISLKKWLIENKVFMNLQGIEFGDKENTFLWMSGLSRIFSSSVQTLQSWSKFLGATFGEVFADAKFYSSSFFMKQNLYISFDF